LRAAFVVSRFVRVERSIKQYPKGEKRTRFKWDSMTVLITRKLAEFTAAHKRARQIFGQKFR
jgi:hypothetical protein